MNILMPLINFFKKYKKWIQFGVSLVLVSYLFSTIDVSLFWNTLKTLHGEIFVIGSAMILPGIFLSAFRWTKILKVLGYSLSPLLAFFIYWKASFYSQFLPTSFGGDGYRFWYLSQKYTWPAKDILRSLLFERGIGIFALAMVYVFFFSVLYFFLPIFSSLILFPVFLSLFFACIGLLLIITFSSFFLRIFSFFPKIHSFLSIFLSFPLSSFLFSLSLALCFHGMVIIAYMLYFLAFDITVSWYIVALWVGFSSFVTMLPLSLNGMGLTESLFVFFFHLFYPDLLTETLLSIIFMGRISSIFWTGIGGLVHIPSYH